MEPRWVQEIVFGGDNVALQTCLPHLLWFARMNSIIPVELEAILQNDWTVTLWSAENTDGI
jgi:hypothetical protein